MKNPINELFDEVKKYVDSNPKEIKKNKEDYEDNTPFLLGENIKHLYLTLNDCIEKDKDFFEELRAIENHRGHTLTDSYSYIQDKYYHAYRTNNLLNIKKSNYILLLQGYETKTTKFEWVSLQHITNSNEINNLVNLSNKLKGMPIVYVQNPMDSGPLKSFFIWKRQKSANIYRVNYGVDWLEKVEVLMHHASSIIIDMTNKSTGLDKEIALIKKNKYIDKTYCLNTNMKAVNGLEISDIKYLTEHLDSIKSTCKKKVSRKVYIEVAGLWISGNRRNDLINNYSEILKLIEESALNGKNLSGAACLDLFTYLIVLGLQLEDPWRMHFGIYNKVLTISQYKKQDLKNRNKLIYSYLSFLFEIELTFPLSENAEITFNYNLDQYTQGRTIKYTLKRFWCYFKHKFEYLGALNWKSMNI